MIIIGYQGIGKSTLVKNDLLHQYIDLESGNFWIPEKVINNDAKEGSMFRDQYWYLAYVNIAEDLSRQRFRVFVSSHEPVRKRLQQSKELVVAIRPDLDLKDQWLQRLKDRYENSHLDKDYKAYMNAVERFDDNIKEIDRDVYNIIPITSMTYNIDQLILNFQERDLLHL